MPTRIKPVHPGEVLAEEFLKPMGLSQYRLATDIGVQPTRISQIVKGRTGIPADTALRPGRCFQMSAQFWLDLQARYDLETTRERIQRRLDREATVRSP